MDRTEPHDEVFVALADPHRRQILGWLREEPQTVGALVARLPLSQPGVTKHLGVLERAGLIRRRARGRERICELTPEGLAPLETWLADYRGFWERALDRIAELAEETPDDPDGNERNHRSDDEPRDRGKP
ncbi:MAG: metalloregulator ArsR/SmtB family transcription factor [Pseudomonadota bacterium]